MSLTDDLLAQAIDKAPAPFKPLVATYLPVLSRMGLDELSAFYTHLKAGDNDAAQAAVRVKMTDAELLAETQTINQLTVQREAAHATLTDFGNKVIATALSWALTGLLAPVGL